MELLFLRSEKSEDPALASLQQSVTQAHDHQIEDHLEQMSPLPPYFALNLFALACGDALLLIVEIHWTNFFRIAPILSRVCQIVGIPIVSEHSGDETCLYHPCCSSGRFPQIGRCATRDILSAKN